jgi:hypothetical protein
MAKFQTRLAEPGLAKATPNSTDYEIRLRADPIRFGDLFVILVIVICNLFVI